MVATIYNVPEGYALVNSRTGETIATYSRARDARRGASRRGFALAD